MDALFFMRQRERERWRHGGAVCLGLGFMVYYVYASCS
jgi:hypothetical protein